MADNTATLAAIGTAFKARSGAPKHGTATFSPNGSATAFTIAHGVGKIPTSKWVTPLNTASGRKPVLTADGTNLTVTYPVAPASGTNTLKLRWGAAGL
jgi:hypothetical protein